MSSELGEAGPSGPPTLPSGERPAETGASSGESGVHHDGAASQPGRRWDATPDGSPMIVERRNGVGRSAAERPATRPETRRVSPRSTPTVQLFRHVRVPPGAAAIPHRAALRWRRSSGELAGATCLLCWCSADRGNLGCRGGVGGVRVRPQALADGGATAPPRPSAASPCPGGWRTNRNGVPGGRSSRRSDRHRRQRRPMCHVNREPDAPECSGGPGRRLLGWRCRSVRVSLRSWARMGLVR